MARVYFTAPYSQYVLTAPALNTVKLIAHSVTVHKVAEGPRRYVFLGQSTWVYG